jgi:hypothetical protein
MNKFRKEEEPSDLFEIAGVKYYFDLDQLTQFIRIEKPESVDDILGEAKKELTKKPENTEDTEDSENEELVEAELEGYSQIIDITKWETTKVMIETVLTEQGPIDEAMGRTKLSNQLSIPFKLSFNTLLKYQIIKEENGR